MLQAIVVVSRGEMACGHGSRGRRMNEDERRSPATLVNGSFAWLRRGESHFWCGRRFDGNAQTSSRGEAVNLLNPLLSFVGRAL